MIQQPQTKPPTPREFVFRLRVGWLVLLIGVVWKGISWWKGVEVCLVRISDNLYYAIIPTLLVSIIMVGAVEYWKFRRLWRGTDEERQEYETYAPGFSRALCIVLAVILVLFCY